MCGPHRRSAPLLSRTLRRIPQAVGTVATQHDSTNDFTGQRSNVSIPQAVDSIALSASFYLLFVQVLETGGPHRRFTPLLPHTLRRIPQAVGTVATKRSANYDQMIGQFQYRKRQVHFFIPCSSPSLCSGT